QCVAKTTGGHYPAINDTNLRKVVIVVPPLPEQRRIVSHLIAVQTQVKELKQIQDRIGAELDALMLSILDKAFKGEL
ncbi:MAG: restriction endonuclease subunit S, partial [Thermodesulfobacteriota bacterium]|nr:restriction endonuclease subunit S [Thermodesulfobacteriota bacterium]